MTGDVLCRLIVRAIKRFVENEGAAREGVEGSISMLPLSGNLPDMHADTKSYIELQNIYREQASRDHLAVSAHLEVLAACPYDCVLGAIKGLPRKIVFSLASLPAAPPGAQANSGWYVMFISSSSAYLAGARAAL